MGKIFSVPILVKLLKHSHIKETIFDDRGHYVCQVNTKPLKTQSGFINEDTSGEMTVQEGSSVQLICKSRGFPEPIIIWRRENGHDIIAQNDAPGRIKPNEYDLLNNIKPNFIYLKQFKTLGCFL